MENAPKWILNKEEWLGVLISSGLLCFGFTYLWKEGRASMAEEEARDRSRFEVIFRLPAHLKLPSGELAPQIELKTEADRVAKDEWEDKIGDVLLPEAEQILSVKHRLSKLPETEASLNHQDPVVEAQNLEAGIHNLMLDFLAKIHLAAHFTDEGLYADIDGHDGFHDYRFFPWCYFIDRLKDRNFSSFPVIVLGNLFNKESPTSGCVD